MPELVLKQYVKKYQEELIVISSIILALFAFLYFTGTLVSGYHFADDHEIIRIKDDLRSSSVLNVSAKWIEEDINVTRRFRPLYYFQRVVETKVFGSDYFALSVYTGFLACITLISFYLTMRNMKFRTGESVIFLLIAFTGPQMAVWWRLGPSETLGLTFLGISFYFMSLCTAKGRRPLYEWLFVLSLILASLCKESILISIPGVVFLKVYNEKINDNLKWCVALKKNSLILLPLAVMLLEVTYIVMHVGAISANDNGFHGIIKGVFNNLIILIKTYPFLGLAGLILLLLNFYNKNRFFKLKWMPVIFAFIILIPNLVLYANSGFYERYLLPSSIGFGLVTASIISGFDDNYVKLKRIAYVILILSVSPLLIRSYSDARSFSNEGLLFKNLVSSITKNCKSGDHLLVAVDPVDFYEQSYSLKKYLLLEKNIILYGFPVTKTLNDKTSESLFEGWKRYFNDSQFDKLSSSPNLIVFLDKNLIKNFFNFSGITQDEYISIMDEGSSFALLKRK